MRAGDMAFVLPQTPDIKNLVRLGTYLRELWYATPENFRQARAGVVDLLHPLPRRLPPSPQGPLQEPATTQSLEQIPTANPASSVQEILCPGSYPWINIAVASNEPQIFEGKIIHHLPNFRENDSVLLIPANPFFQDIDALYVQVQHQTQKVDVVPIQISISKKHKDSESLFYQKIGLNGNVGQKQSLKVINWK